MALGVGGTWRATGGRLGGKGTTFAYILPRTPTPSLASFEWDRVRVLLKQLRGNAFPYGRMNA